MPKLTQRYLESLRPDMNGQLLRDEGGLFGTIRAKSNGSISVSFYYRYRFGGKFKDISCGTWPTTSLAVIRAKRDDARATVTAGNDPAAEKRIVREERQLESAAKLTALEQQRTVMLTFADMYKAWIEDGVRRKDDNAELKRTFSMDVLPTLGSTPVSEVTEHDLRDVLRIIVKRGANRSAVIRRNDLAQLFAWARKRQPWRKLLVEGDPMDLIEIEKIVASDYDLDSYRKRILSSDEIKELHQVFARRQAEYEAAPDKRKVPQPLNRTTQLAIWIMLSTLTRVGETSMARWEHVDLKAGEWFIPKANVKDAVSDLTIYLSPFALDQFKMLQEITGETDWCFPSRDRKSHLDEKAITKQITDRQWMFKVDRDGNLRKPKQKRVFDNSLVLSGGANGKWTSHDLRRTGATMMQSLGVPLDIIDRCQNHVLGGSKVRRSYMHHDYAAEKYQAWYRLGERLSELIFSKPSGCDP